MSNDRTEFWRVETRRGVETIRVWPSRVHQHDTWNASHPRYGTVDIRRSPRDAAEALVYVAQVHAPVLAPGAPTRDELFAALRAAARGELPTCTRRDCQRLATQRCETEAGEFDACDEHARNEGRDFYNPHSSGWQDLPHAATLRAVTGGGA